VAVGGDSGAVHVWAVDDDSVQQLAGSGAPVGVVAVHPQGLVAAGASDGAVRLWTTPRHKGGGDTSGRLLGRHDDSVERLLWLAPDRLVSAAVDGTISVWRLDQSPTGAVLPVRWYAHKGAVRGLGAGPSGRVLVSIGADGVLAVWNLEGRLMASIKFPGQLYTVATHSTQPVIGLGGDAGLVHITEIVNLAEPW
jgi:WD40 repeat protein